MDYYESPAIEVVETVMEQGFTLSDLNGNINDWKDGGSGDGDMME